MLTNEQIENFYADVKRLGLKFPVAAICEKTGYSKGTVSEWLNRKRTPSEAFIDKFYKEFAKELNAGTPNTDKIKALDAAVAVLLGEVAALRAERSGESVQHVLLQLQRAVEDVAKMI